MKPWQLVFTILLSSWHAIETCPTQYCQCSAGWMVSVTCQSGAVSNIVQNLPQRVNSLEMVTATITASTISAQDFETINTSTLRTIIIRKSYIQTIRSITFNKFSNLETLNLTDNGIRVIEKDAFLGLNYLQRLDLSNNEIQNLAEIFLPLRNLRQLYLAANRIVTIAGGSFSSQNILTSLSLDRNEIQSFTGSSFQGLNNLQYLSMRKCELSTISNELLGAFKKVTTLDLGENSIYNLPSADTLRRHAPNLHNLKLDHNDITSLNNGQFSGMTLTSLDLSYNKLTRLSKENFGQCNVDYLDLSSNSIIEVRDSAFVTMAPRLTSLNLAYNSVMKLPAGAFSGLYSLQNLNLSASSLSELDKEQFQHTSRLHVLDISRNSLQNIPISVFHSFQFMGQLYIDGNRWHCDCQIKPFRDWLKIQRNQMLLGCTVPNLNRYQCQNPRCFTPEKLAFKEIQLIEDSEIPPCEESSESSGISVGAIIGIAIGCILFCIIIAIVIFICWRRSKGKDGFIPCKGPESVLSSHKENFDNEKGVKKSHNDDQVSLQSDKSFIVRHYFQTMVSTDPSVTEHNSPERMRRDTFRTNFSGSNPSLASCSSYSYPMGRETAI